MPMKRSLHAAAALVLLSGPAFAGSASTSASTPEAFTLATLDHQPAWCAPEMDAIADDVCHVAGSPAPDGRRTLVVYLHGVIPENTMWQWLQERAFARMAKELHVDALVPRAPLSGTAGAQRFAWPALGGRAAVDVQTLVKGWVDARRALEARDGRPYDEVYVVGFSSGAYLASALATRGAPMDVDGYVALAGGAIVAPAAPDADLRRAPLFVGVCADDATSATDARELGRSLRARGFAVRIDEQRVGHGLSHAHVAHALGWFRATRARAAQTPSLALL